MTAILVFVLGMVSGIILLVTLALIYVIRYSKRRKALYDKAGGLWEKAGQLFDTAKLWAQIGDTKSAEEAFREASRLAAQAEDIEDEADGRQKAA